MRLMPVALHATNKNVNISHRTIYETLTGELIRVPGLLLLRCRACGVLRVPPFEISKIENVMSNIRG